MGVVSLRCHRYLPSGHADSGKMAFQFFMGDRHARRRVGADGRNLQNHDCLRNTEWHQQNGTPDSENGIAGSTSGVPANEVKGVDDYTQELTANKSLIRIRAYERW